MADGMLTVDSVKCGFEGIDNDLSVGVGLQTSGKRGAQVNSHFEAITPVEYTQGDLGEDCLR